MKIPFASPPQRKKIEKIVYEIVENRKVQLRPKSHFYFLQQTTKITSAVCTSKKRYDLAYKKNRFHWPKPRISLPGAPFHVAAPTRCWEATVASAREGGGLTSASLSFSRPNPRYSGGQ
jgi:hypothetical protein